MTPKNIIPYSGRVRSRPGFVYLLRVVGVVNGPTKIGKTTDVSDRRKLLGVLMPYDTRLVWVFRCVDMHAVESALHEYFSAKHINGEWYDLSEEDLSFVKSSQIVTEPKYPKFIQPRLPIPLTEDELITIWSQSFKFGG